VTLVAIALGSNLGDRVANLRAAVRLLGEQGIRPLRTSSIWETEPIPADQPAFLNAALTAETEAEPLDVLRRLKGIEAAMGRRPERRWGPRPIDLDLLFYGDTTVDTPELTVPHPRIPERAFVLAPLAEAWPGELPVLARRAVDILHELPPGGVERMGYTLDPGVNLSR